MPPPPLERDPDDELCEEPDEGDELPLDECDEPLPPDDGRLTVPDPLLPCDDDDPERLPPRTVPLELPPRPLLPDECEPLGESRAPPIDPITRRTVSPEPRHESLETPERDCVALEALPDVEGLLTGSFVPPRMTVRGCEPTVPPEPELPVEPDPEVKEPAEPGELAEPPRAGLPRQSLLAELLLPLFGRSTVESLLLLSLPPRGVASTGAWVSWFRGCVPPLRGAAVVDVPALLPDVDDPPVVVEPPPRGIVLVPPPRGLTVPLVAPEVAAPLAVLPLAGRSIVPPAPLPPRGVVVLVEVVELVVPPEGSVLPGRELVTDVAPRSPFPRVLTRSLTSCDSAGSLWKN